MVMDSYLFVEKTYENLATSGIPPLAVTDVLYSTPTVRRHFGSSLQVAGQDRDGAWLAVALVEDDDDDTYTVTGARHLDDDEIDAITRIIEKEER
ncbi:hypothetical protein [Phytoactinopolyspora halotolerans]|uniref:DUF4258 domain-containing protein n=1 Tax=Phytoactinopolyspora halotolerans TaxID=1981512 RepID=A0A6L9SFI8_9ACTN|nr:hypothetical protein [Phytoactinopolyspora halotolerans]NEE03833.1 hypothetical protein [Phytoactinopolyspora halotolerans]